MIFTIKKELENYFYYKNAFEMIFTIKKELEMIFYSKKSNWKWFLL